MFKDPDFFRTQTYAFGLGALLALAAGVYTLALDKPAGANSEFFGLVILVLVPLLGLCAIGAGITVFVYKQRQLQVRLGTAMAVLALLATPIAYVQYGINEILVLSALSFVATTAGIRAVKSDIKKLKNMNRFRS